MSIALVSDSGRDGEKDAQRAAALSAGENGGEADDKQDDPTVLDRVLSRTSSRMVPGPPPDGGRQAWLTCACVHIAVMNTWGMITSFGVFQTYYTSDLGWPASDTSWVGSTQIFLLFFIGTISGRLTDAGYFRAVVSTGIALQALGTFTLAQSTQYWQFFLSQGIAMGLGDGLIFCPCMSVLSTYFQRRRSFAIGIVACGSASGGLVYPSIVRQMLPQVGFAWTVRTLAFLQLATMATASALIRPRLPPRRGGPFVEWSAFRELPYDLYILGTFLSLWGVYVAFFYVASFSRDVIGLNYASSLNLLLVVNGVGAVGRIVPNFLADRYGALGLFFFTGCVAGIAALAWTAVRSVPSMYVWTVAYGLAGGGIQSLFPACLTSLTADLSKTGVRMGMVFSINSFATLTGPPIGGALVSAAHGSYTGAQVFTGVTLLVGAVFVGATKLAVGRTLEGGWKAKV